MNALTNLNQAYSNYSNTIQNSKETLTPLIELARSYKATEMQSEAMRLEAKKHKDDLALRTKMWRATINKNKAPSTNPTTTTPTTPTNTDVNLDGIFKTDIIKSEVKPSGNFFDSSITVRKSDREIQLANDNKHETKPYDANKIVPTLNNGNSTKQDNLFGSIVKKDLDNWR